MRQRLRQRLLLFATTVFSVSLLLSDLGPLHSATAHAQRGKSDTLRILYIPLDNLPELTNEQIIRRLSRRGTLLSTARYRRAARRRGMRYSSLRTIKKVGVSQKPDLIVVAGFRSVRRRLINITYRDGENAGKLEEIEFRLSRNDELSKKNIKRIDRNLRESLDAYANRHDEDVEMKKTISWPTSGKKAASGEGITEEPYGDDEAQGEEGLAEDEEALTEEIEEADVDDEGEELESPVYLSLRAGAGVGHRSIRLPAAGGKIRLKTSPYLNANVELQTGFYVGSGKYLLGIEGDYESSIALSLAEQFADGTTRSVDSRSHRTRFGLFTNFRLGDKTDKSPYIQLAGGFAFRFFVTEQAISVPRSTLAGPYFRPGFFFNVGEGPLKFGIVPQFDLVLLVSQGIQDAGVSSLGAIVGAEFQAEYFVREWLRVGLLYRESHALMSSDFEGQYHDAMRTVMLRAMYFM